MSWFSCVFVDVIRYGVSCKFTICIPVQHYRYKYATLALWVI